MRPLQGARRLLFGLAQRRRLLLQPGELRLPLRQRPLLLNLLFTQRRQRGFALRQLGETLLPQRQRRAPLRQRALIRAPLLLLRQRGLQAVALCRFLLQGARALRQRLLLLVAFLLLLLRLRQQGGDLLVERNNLLRQQRLLRLLLAQRGVARRLGRLAALPIALCLLLCGLALLCELLLRLLQALLLMQQAVALS